MMLNTFTHVNLSCLNIYSRVNIHLVLIIIFGFSVSSGLDVTGRGCYLIYFNVFETRLTYFIVTFNLIV